MASTFTGPLITDTYDQAAATIAAALRIAGRTANQATSAQVKELINVFDRDVAASERKVFFQTLGERAQSAIVSSYKARARGPSGYRAEGRGKMRRYAGGQMLSALEDSDLIFEATSRGITFLPNVGQLDARARQWYRLNFGALPNAGRRPARFDVSISNLFLFSIGFSTPPSEPFRIPRGFFIENGQAVEPGPRGTSEFYPARVAKSKLGLNRGRTKAEQVANNFFPGRRQASGIQAENFLDAGLNRFTQDLGDPGREGIGLRGLYFKFYDRRLVSVRPTRPPVVGVSRFG